MRNTTPVITQQQLELNALIKEARNLTWETKIEEAEELYKKCEIDHLCAFHYAELEVVRALLSNEHEISDSALNRLSIAENLIMTFLDSNQQKSFFEKVTSFAREIKYTHNENFGNYSLASVLLCEVYLMNSGVLFRRGSYVKGAFYIRKAWKSFEHQLKHFEQQNISPSNFSNATENEQYTKYITDAWSSLHFGLGIFFFFTSLVPSKFGWILERIGFQISRQKGIEHLKMCYQEGGHRAPIALLLLIWIQQFFLEEDCSELYQEAMSKYPLFHYLQGYLYRKKGGTFLPQALQSFQTCFDLSSQIRLIQISCTYELGWCHYLKLDWGEAVRFFESFLKENKTTNFRAFCGYQLGICYTMMEERQKAVKIFHKVPGWARKHFTYDQYAARKSIEYSQQDVPAIEKDLILASILVEGNQFSEARDLISQLPTKHPKQLTGSVASDYFASYLYLKGLVLRGYDDTDGAIVEFEKLLAMESEIQQETYSIPHALCEIAEIHLYLKKDAATASTYFHRAKEHSDFDFDKPLMRRIAKSLDTIKSSSSSVE